jgi:hypothetical protein
MDKRLIAAFTALLEIRDNAAHEIEHYTGADRVGEWLPLRPESIDSFSSIAAELRNKIDAWRAFGIDEHALKPSPHRNVELLYRVFDAISATDAVLKDLEALHAGLLKFAQLLRERFESMRPAARDYWTNAEPVDTFEATEDWQQVLRQRRFDHVQSVLGMLPSHEHQSNADIWQQTGFAIAVANGIEWNAGTLPAGCFAWALDEIAGAESSEGANGFKWQDNTTDGWAIWFGTTDRTFRDWANVKKFEWIKNTGRGRYSVNVTHPEVVAKRSKAETEIRKRSGR